MLRRTFIQSASATPFATPGTGVPNSTDTLSNIGESFFESFASVDKSDRNGAIVKCANGLCAADEESPRDFESIIDDISRINTHLRRIRFGVQILNEHNITQAIDVSMVKAISNQATPITRFLPLLGSFNNLQIAACEVGSKPSDNEVRNFLYACLAFGLEVGFWYSGSPFKMAWRGTRFVSNRTFLRYANHGCNGCIALIMSELHWALRAVPYSITSKQKVEFVVSETARLSEIAATLNYNVDIELSSEEVQRIISSKPPGGGGVVIASNQSQNWIDIYWPLGPLGIGFYLFWKLGS
jgi:hypothetical protein